MAVFPPNPALGVNLPAAVRVPGSRRFQSETQLAYELSYRFSFSDKASVDMTAFYNDYDKLQSLTPGTPFLHSDPAIHLDIPVILSNQLRASTWGFEAATAWQMTDWLRWDANYSYLNTSFDNDLGTEPISPEHKMSVRTVINPVDNVNLDFWLRFNSSAQATEPLRGVQKTTKMIKDYITFDVRLAWKPHPAVELSMVGQNLLADQHLEYIDETFVQPTVVPRSFYGKVAFEF